MTYLVNLEVAAPSVYSVKDCLSPLRMDLPFALNRECSGLHQQQRRATLICQTICFLRKEATKEKCHIRVTLSGRVVKEG